MLVAAETVRKIRGGRWACRIEISGLSVSGVRVEALIVEGRRGGSVRWSEAAALDPLFIPELLQRMGAVK